ncbi:M48 family metallopeptidase [Halapricum salinum]|nr:M48 family metalloprotease [Halapricum salinum]
MSRLSRRALMWLVGTALLVVYLLAALLTYELFVYLLERPPDPLTALLTIGLVVLVASYLSYRFGTRQLLAGLGGIEIRPRNAPALFDQLDRLEQRMTVERPRVVVADLGVPNAFALGGVRSGVLVFDRSLLRVLSPDEREAILAHELAHLESYDAFVQTLSYSVLRTIVGLLLLPLLPLLFLVTGIARGLAWIRGRPGEWTRNPVMVVYYWATLSVTLLAIGLTVLIRAHSRRREYAADDRAVEITGRPLALARALRKIDRATERQRGLLSTLYVQGDDEGVLTRLLSTHPPMDDRIERLLDRAEADSLRGRRVPIE